MEEKAILTLKNIKKDYYLKGNTLKVHALKGVSLSFRSNEFVSILGPSGCGKTTLLNIIGGLDQYTEGDLIIANRSTKNYSAHDWDVYRNHRIGFIFQSYNLIPHQTILGNVELALTIGGLSKKERIEKAKKVLDKVGLKDLYNKHPNQLSGGQCQRVAIARALVNEPEILLADEPTGALDTETSKQIMDLIQEISKEKLVIMVTHNPDIATAYSSRIIKLLDGNVVDDSNPFNNISETSTDTFKIKNEKAKMSFFTAFKLSLKNLISKAKRTVLVCVAGSIGIVGVSTVLAISSGVHNYIDSMQDDMLSGNPITISETTYDLSSLLSQSTTKEKVEMVLEADTVNVNSLVEYLVEKSNTMTSYAVSNEITEDYISYIKEMNKDDYAAMTFDYGIDITNYLYTDWHYDETLTKNMSVSSITKMYTEVLKKTSFKDYASYVSQLSDNFAIAPNNNDYILEQYDLLEGKVATEKDEIMIVVSKKTQLTDILLCQLGYFTQEEFVDIVYKATESENFDEELYKSNFTYKELLNKVFTLYTNDTIFTKNEGLTSDINPFTYSAYEDTSWNNGLKLKVTGILRAKDDISYGCLESGFYYTQALSDYLIEQNKNSELINYYKDKDIDSISSGAYEATPGVSMQTGITFNYDYIFEGEEFNDQVGYLGSESMMTTIMSYISKSMGGSGSSSSSNFTTITLRELGGETIPNYVSIYPTNFDSKYKVTDYLDAWNDEGTITLNNKEISKDTRGKITYTDNLELIITLINTMIDIVTYALIVFTALSLLVSTVMIGIITYVSVVERVKEIGVIRAIGGRKKDVAHLFNAETFILGLASGIFGILITLFLSLIINLIVGHLAGIYTIAALQVKDAFIMIGVSIILTLISGLIPSRAAANKDPVIALRTE